MNLSEQLKSSLRLSCNDSIVCSGTFKSLLENCFSVLQGGEETHNVALLYNSKPDVVKELYGALLAVTAEFIRNNQSTQQAMKVLVDLGWCESRAVIYGDIYERTRIDIEISLMNIGNHLPHVTDVLWKLDHVVKTSRNLDEGGGPLFRISLQTTDRNDLNFSCDVQELQDLVYKLKDVLNHCRRIASEL